MDLWGDTSGTYAGFDRFGRITDLKVENFSGTAYAIARRQYQYDRASNRTKIVDPFWKLTNGLYDYDDRHRLTREDRGWTQSSQTQLLLASLSREFNMDEIGAPVTDEINSVSTTVDYDTNATNEITRWEIENPAWHDLAATDDFATAIAAPWDDLAGTWAIDTGKLKASALTSGQATIEFAASAGDTSYQAKVALPAMASSEIAGIYVGTDADAGYAVTISVNPSHLSIVQVSGTPRTIGTRVAFSSPTILGGVEYTITVVKRQQTITAWLNQDSVSIVTYSSSSMNPAGTFGLLTERANTTFDDFRVWEGFPSEQGGPRSRCVSRARARREG